LSSAESMDTDTDELAPVSRIFFFTEVDCHRDWTISLLTIILLLIPDQSQEVDL
jgi:hypothetical protein